jgi:predicted DNA-binding transcriptional regulator YafY
MKVLIQRLNRLDYLINHKSTGTPAACAKKIGISERSLYDYLKILKELGAPVKFSRDRRTYYYFLDGNFKIGFFDTQSVSLEEMV